jgi:hypothetical protein
MGEGRLERRRSTSLGTCDDHLIHHGQVNFKTGGAGLKTCSGRRGNEFVNALFNISGEYLIEGCKRVGVGAY